MTARPPRRAPWADLARLARAAACAALAACALASPARATPVQSAPPGYVVESWSVRDGLPIGECTAMVQTRDGYVWVATTDGLSRFDGVRFRTLDTRNTTGLTSNHIMFLLEGRDGTLWFCTDDAGVGAIRGGRVTMYPPDSCLAGGQAQRLIECADGTIWVSHSRGVSRWHDGRLAPVAAARLHESALVMSDDGAGGIWTSTRSGVAHVSARGDVRAWRLVADPADHAWWQPYRDVQGRVWLATKTGLCLLQGDTFVPYTAPGLPGGEPWRILYDDPTSPWPVLRSAGAFSRFVDGAWRTYRPGALSRFKTDPAWDAGQMWFAIAGSVYRDGERMLDLPSETTQLIRDREGNIWVATNGDGVFRIGASPVTMAGGIIAGVRREVVAVGVEDDGSLWLGALGQPPVHVNPDRSDLASESVPAMTRIFAWVREGGGRYLAATGDGVMRLTFAPGGRVTREPLLRDAGSVSTLAVAPDGTIWAACEQGLMRGRDGHWAAVPDSVLGTRAPIAAIACVGSRTWIGTLGGGLVVIDGARVRRISGGDGLPHGAVGCLLPAGVNAMWVGFTNAGLAHVQLSPDGTPRVHALRREDGLSDDAVNSLLDDGAGRLWLGTSRGIAMLPIAALEARLAGGREPLRPAVFDENDGMLSGQCSSTASSTARGADGRLWFATRNGAAGIDPRRALAPAASPAPLVEEVEYRGAELPRAGGEVAIAPDQRNFTVRYTALSSSGASQLHFRYRLLGVDRDWVDAGTRREAYFTRVPPGRHVFELQVADRFGRWNATIASRTLAVQPAFIETWAFRALVGLALAMLAFAVYRWRVQRFQRRQLELTAMVSQRTQELEDALRTVAAQTRSLEDLDRAKSRFFANISHEFRTPLTLTLGPLEDVLGGAVGPVPDEVRTELEVALRNSRRLLQLVNEILDLAKLESGRMHLSASENDLRVAIAEWSRSFQPLAERKRIRLTTDLSDQLLPVWFDHERLGKAITNLLSNAFKFTPEGGHVEVRAIAAAQGAQAGVLVSVRDSGPGIPEGERERIFERFYQVDETRRRFTPGTGIGLALARELVELHGGRIAVESREGEGATFTVWVPAGREHLSDAQVAAGARDADVSAPLDPMALEPPAAAGAAATAAADDAEADTTTVLVVDDNDELRALVRRGLAARYRVTEARDGREALAMARANPPDLVVSDVMMPEMDGFELVAAFRADPDLDYVPMVLLTARAESEDRIAGLQHGADDYVEKPFRGEELLARVDNLIAGRKRLRERFGRDFRIASAAAPPGAADRTYLEKLREVIGTRLGEEEFSVALLAEAMHQDRTQLFRRVRDLLGVAPTDLLRTARLDRASELLMQREGNVGEIAYAVGFKSVSHFSQAFRQRFGASPTAWARREANATAVARAPGAAS
jgi:signal transduction histidine kinase/DNA-binding response OmpR family regulator/ligand-binding sensor domain-containing protein